MSPWRASTPKIWRWRVRGRSSDSRLVTLGKYDTEADAKADHRRIVSEGFYRDVSIEEIKPLPERPTAKS